MLFCPQKGSINYANVHFVDFCTKFLSKLPHSEIYIILSKNTAGGTSLSKPQTNKVLLVFAHVDSETTA